MATIRSYYAAANTEKGFCSLFGEVFSPDSLSHIYIIKGGPGTGKSTFIKSIGAEAEALGLDSEYYYCSADTSSLDGIKIPALGTAVIDGTPPHACEPRYPGACEKIINLGECLDEAALSERRGEIERLTRECGECYTRGAHFLAAAGETERAKLAILSRAFDFEKARLAARRLLARAKPMGGKSAERYISALGTHGKAHICNAQETGEKTVLVSGRYGAETLFLSVLEKEARREGYTLLRSPCVLLKEYTESLSVKELQTRFVTLDEAEEELNAMRFVCREALAESRGKLRFAEKCREALLQGALSELAKMGRTHDELEKYYISAMDFEKSGEILAGVKSEIFG
jgi:hypothetical protein